ncbi:ABC transporter permease [Parasutterella sp.]|uniref:ABC transporter permease n=1 Tax=Parasutterella sp. TaxID=2049037 RepID=UPI0035202F29
MDLKLMQAWRGVKDVCYGVRGLDLPLFLAKSDIRQRYRRSTLGPFWLTISTGVMIACLGLIFGKIFKSPINQFLPFLSAGLIIWGFISQVVIEATGVFTASEAIMKQLPIPYFSHVIRMVARNFIIFLHNLIIFPIVCLLFKIAPTATILLVIPGLALLILNLLWISLFLGIICTRYRDLTQIVSSLLQIAFYVTPIIWLPSLLPAKSSTMLLDPNPVYHLMQIVRCPLLNQPPTLLNWIVSIGMAVIGWLFTLMVFNRYRTRIAYWL